MCGASQPIGQDRRAGPAQVVKRHGRAESSGLSPRALGFLAGDRSRSPSGQLGRVDRPEVGDVDTALLAAQRRRQRDEQDSRQLMARIWGARIAHLAQDRQHRVIAG